MGDEATELPVSGIAHESTDSGMSSGKDFNVHSNGVRVYFMFYVLK